MKDSRLIPRNAQRVHCVPFFWRCRNSPWRVGFIFRVIFSSLFVAAGPAHAQGFDAVSITASVLSEPAQRGVSEANGRPAVALAVDWDVNDAWVLGAHGYVATDAPAPQRPQSLTVYGGWHWSPDAGPSLDVALLHHIFPGDFAIDWDHTEARVDVHFSRNLALTIRATDAYYGIGGTSVTGAISAVRDLSDAWYARIELGAVSVDRAQFDSYGYIEFGGGYSVQRLTLEVLLRTNSADPSPAFTNAQIDTAITATVSYKLL